MKKHLVAMSMMGAGLLGCQPQPSPADSAAQPSDIAAQLDVKYQVISNLNNQCHHDGDCYDAQLLLRLPFDSSTTDWAIYFSNTKPIRFDDSPLFDITHLNGDVHRLSPTDAFSGFVANQTYIIGFQGGNSAITKNDVMPNFILQSGDQAPQVIRSTEEVYDPETQLWTLPHAGEFDAPEQWKRSENDAVPRADATWLYSRYSEQGVPQSIDRRRIIPALKQANWQDQNVEISRGLNLQFDAPEAARLALNERGIAVDTTGFNVRHEHVEMPEEHYRVEISAKDIVIQSSGDTGTYYALQSLAQLYDADSQTLPVGDITDGPRYGFRGVHIDVARNYHDKGFLLRLIQQMGALKLNKLHLHLAEDEAWRLEIPGLPELTDIGARRCLDLDDRQCMMPQLGAGVDPNSQVNGYLSTQDYKDILVAAQAHQIEVIPSLDMPGHSRAAIQAMEARYRHYMQQEQPDLARQYLLIDLQDTTEYSSIQYYNDNTINPCIASSYDFIAKVLGEIKNLHDQAGVPLKRYHIGADETAGAWVESPACQALMAEQGIEEAEHLTAYFVARVTHMVNDMGVMAGAWSDGLSHVEPMKLGSRIQANLWGTLPSGGHQLAHEMTNRGWDTVLSLPDVLYFDFPYMAHPDETGYYWGSRYTSTFQVFQFMPDNLPAHAEIWTDAMGHPYVSEDNTPLQTGRKVSGIQAQIWSETLRHETDAEYMLYPRLLAVAERAWHEAQWEVPYQPGVVYGPETGHMDQARLEQRRNDWQSFVGAMVSKVLPRLTDNGVFYRLPPAGAVLKEGQLHTQVPWPGLQVEYRIEGDAQWQDYRQPVSVPADKAVAVRTYLPLSDRRSRTLWLNR
ncbi:carbohydate-binding domain-containing protein [Aestuariibacter halophilus]|uniref:beta-N-acetylhexosaminidase n=1 Tax=Fluctibacter halophilus TaxID=226011 RepID=A0ABS8G9Y5_9ALTE|nr:family 20 glycosylhydrolase [Aestuariibacter halophilus]MCC2617308.1 carbohydate-binding domain-containing protein [Aestuariibacter halophilus]